MEERGGEGGGWPRQSHARVRNSIRRTRGGLGGKAGQPREVGGGGRRAPAGGGRGGGKALRRWPRARAGGARAALTGGNKGGEAGGDSRDRDGRAGASAQAPPRTARHGATRAYARRTPVAARAALAVLDALWVAVRTGFWPTGIIGTRAGLIRNYSTYWDEGGPNNI
jgi:hypothetical protein